MPCTRPGKSSTERPARSNSRYTEHAPNPALRRPVIRLQADTVSQAWGSAPRNPCCTIAPYAACRISTPPNIDAPEIWAALVFFAANWPRSCATMRRYAARIIRAPRYCQQYFKNTNEYLRISTDLTTYPLYFTTSQVCARL